MLGEFIDMQTVVNVRNGNGIGNSSLRRIVDRIAFVVYFSDVSCKL